MAKQMEKVISEPPRLRFKFLPSNLSLWYCPRAGHLITYAMLEGWARCPSGFLYHGIAQISPTSSAFLTSLGFFPLTPPNSSPSPYHSFLYHILCPLFSRRQRAMWCRVGCGHLYYNIGLVILCEASSCGIYLPCRASGPNAFLLTPSHCLLQAEKGQKLTAYHPRLRDGMHERKSDNWVPGPGFLFS